VPKSGNIPDVERIHNSPIALGYFSFDTQISDRYNKINTAPVKQWNAFYTNTFLTTWKLNPLRELVYWKVTDRPKVLL